MQYILGVRCIHFIPIRNCGIKHITTREDPSKTVSIGDKISMKYLGTLNHPVAKMVTDLAKKGEVVLIEISPKFFSTRNYSKAQL